jgi:hypothetical protein
MAKRAAFPTACFAIFLCLVLSGCVARGPQLSAGSTELAQTPFFPQQRFQCGPASLAMVLAASGASVTPDELTPRLYLPARRGSLQVEMQAVPRSFRRLVLPLPRNPEAIVQELEAGRPVLVLHNYGLPFWPRWHYAVVVGYDARKDMFTLRSGTTKRQEMRTRRFMVAWHHAGRWAMVVLRPGETAANADAQSYLESAAAFEREASLADAYLAFDAAVRRWPTEPLAHVARGTVAYRQGNLAAAARDYSAAVALDPAQVGARNNLAQTLLDLRCPHRARQQLTGIEAQPMPAAVREALNDTLGKIEAAAAAGADAASCDAIL